MVLVAITTWVRMAGLSNNSFTQDESTMVLFARGVLERGYPFLRQGSSDFIISTYELVPYPIALAIKLFGDTEITARLPAVAFSGLTTWLIMRFATELFNRRTGALASLLFALLPWSIYWGRNAFYPSQVALATLLSTMAVFRLISGLPLRPRDYLNIWLAVVFMYLTWEGSIGMLPTFFIVLLMLSWGRWNWLRDIHAWTAAIGIVAVVVAQPTWRTVLREPYQGVVIGRSEVSSAELAFMSPSFDPLYYLVQLASGSHLLIAASLLIGLFWWRRSMPMRYLGLIVLLYGTIMTTLLGYYALRYVFLCAPLLLIMVAAATVMLADQITNRAPKLSAAALGGLTTLHLAVATPWSLNPSQLFQSTESLRVPNELRDDMPGFSFREIAQELLKRIQPGDVIIVQAPFPFQAYGGGQGDYFLQTQTASSVFLTETSLPRYTDKWAGNPVLRTKAELDEVMAKHDRVWFLSAPDGATQGIIGKELYSTILRSFELVIDRGDGRLFLWINPGGETSSNASS